MKAILFTSMIITFMTGAFLFRIKHEVVILEKAIHQVSRKIADTQEEINTLSSELAYLTHPKRIHRLAQKYLVGYEPLKKEQLVDLSHHGKKG